MAERCRMRARGARHSFDNIGADGAMYRGPLSAPGGAPFLIRARRRSIPSRPSGRGEGLVPGLQERPAGVCAFSGLAMLLTVRAAGRASRIRSLAARGAAPRPPQRPSWRMVALRKVAMSPSLEGCSAMRKKSHVVQTMTPLRISQCRGRTSSWGRPMATLARKPMATIMRTPSSCTPDQKRSRLGTSPLCPESLSAGRAGGQKVLVPAGRWREEMSWPSTWRRPGSAVPQRSSPSSQ